MHELTLAENMLQLVEETARRERATRVKTVVVEIGQLALIETDALIFAFDVVKKGGIAANAELRIIDIPAFGDCGNCGVSSPMAKVYATCPQCGSANMQPTAGQEMQLRQIEIE